MSYKLRLGIVGCGGIADEMAGRARGCDNLVVVGAASRRRETAEAFVAKHGIGACFGSWQDMVGSAEIDAVYCATPTAVREEVCLAAVAAGKHVLAEKPFASVASLERIVAAARAAGLAFMDANHFSHHPRTRSLQACIKPNLGVARVLRSAFVAPVFDKWNIRFDPTKEPTGAVGDLGWYCMRAIVEFLGSSEVVSRVSGAVFRDKATSAVVRGCGVMAFEDGKSSTFDFGYSTEVLLMDLDVIGDKAMFRVDDFVRDWHSGFPTINEEHETGYVYRVRSHPPSEYRHIGMDGVKPQAVLMLENFARLCAQPSGDLAVYHADLSVRTQRLLDSYVAAVSV
ncbi:MAG: Gfo/Idh/MocA family oxidoreductase [Gammaproteobacteria bacterium]|nr:Gfo/Idh/MocA family oxidoreductase [Gammaproteobacteria bacterium]